MSEVLIRAEIKTIMESVTGIGAVFDKELFNRSLGDFFELLTKDGKINGWMIGPSSVESELLNVAGMQGWRTFPISGLMEMDNENDSQTVFQALCESIRRTFAQNITLNGKALNSKPISYKADTTDADDFGDRVFHIVNMALEVHDREFF